MHMIRRAGEHHIRGHPTVPVVVTVFSSTGSLPMHPPTDLDFSEAAPVVHAIPPLRAGWSLE